MGIRSASLGYGVDSVRQKFGSKERDIETGLDYAINRYQASVQGRFTSPDPLYLELKRLSDPQRLNLYSFARNNPLKFVDPDGLDIYVYGSEDPEEYLRRLQENVSFSIQLQQVDEGVYKVVLSDNNPSQDVLFENLQQRESEIYTAITDPNNRVSIDLVRRDANVDFGRFDGGGQNTIDLADLDLLDRPANAGGLSSAQVVGHETLEAYAAAKSGATDPADPHRYANGYFGGLGAIDRSTVQFAGYPGPVNQILRVSFEMPIHNGGGVRTRVTREFLTPIPENAIPRGHVPAHIINVENRP